MPMTSASAFRRLLDLPGIADLEHQAVMKPLYGADDGAPLSAESDECSRKLFGLTAEEAAATPRPADWDGVEHQPIARQVAAFEAAGWDVTDNKRRPLRVLLQFNQQLWLALRGVAGELPFQAERDKPDDWGSTLAADAGRFRRR